MDTAELDREIEELEARREALESYKGQEPELIFYREAPEIFLTQEKHRGRPLGFETLDMLLGGVSSGELIVISAPTGVGKTTLCQTITKNLAEKSIGSLWYTLEVGPANFLVPLVKNDAGAVYENNALKKVSDLPIYIVKNTDKIDYETLEKVIRYANLKFGVQHVFIDHLSYLLDPKAVAEARSISLHIGDRLRALRQLAAKTGVSIFLVAHLTKTDDTKDPTLNDLRDSSFVAQEADAVLILSRQRLKQPITTTIEGHEYIETHSPIVKCKVEKSRRTGRKGMFELAYHDGLYYEPTKAQLEVIKMNYKL